MEDQYLECSTHGKQNWGIVCQHLLKKNNTALGFHEFDIEDQGRPDAWCDTCNEAWKFSKNEADRELWEEKCDFKIICASCWDHRKTIHTIPFTYDFEHLNIQEIEDKLIKESSKSNSINIDFNGFALPELYKKVVSQLNLSKISLDTILFTWKETIEINQKSGIENHSIFGSNSDGGFWTFDVNFKISFILFEENIPIITNLDIEFEQWLTMAFVIQKLDLLQHQYLVTRKFKEDFYTSLNQIHPNLSSNYPYLI